MFVSIIPFRHSLSSRPLTYASGDLFENDKPLPVGSIVEIPLGKWGEYGLLVWETVAPENPWIEVREIWKIITKRTVIEPYQIEMIYAISQKYMLPIHRVLAFFLPNPVIKRLEKYGYDILLDWKGKDSTLGWKMIKHELHFFSGESINKENIEKYIVPQSVIICPDDFFLESLREKYAHENVLFLPQESTDTQKAKAWIDISNGKYSQIFCTRRILYYNLARYNKLLYLEDAFGKEYYHFPSKIHFLDVLLALAWSHGGDIDILSSVPLLSTLQKCKHFSHYHHA